MKKILGIISIIAVLQILALGCLGIGLYQRERTRVEEALATLNFANAELILIRLENRMKILSGVPWIMDRNFAEIKLLRNRLYYWRKDYATIFAEAAYDDEKGKTADPALRFIRANARYQVLVAEKNRGKVLQDLRRIIADYAAIIDADPTLADAAYNYEFLLALHDDIATGRRQPQLIFRGEKQSLEGRQERVHGQEGMEPKGTPKDKMKILIPKEGDENPEKQGKEPSRGAATKKSG